MPYKRTVHKIIETYFITGPVPVKNRVRNLNFSRYMFDIKEEYKTAKVTNDCVTKIPM
jgi:hypothetical protein